MGAPSIRPHPAGEDRPSRLFFRLMVLGGVALAGLALALWARYGTVVFMETMASAWAYCF